MSGFSRTVRFSRTLCSRRKSNRQLDGGVLRVHAAIRGADDERRLHPGVLAHRLRKIGAAHHDEHANQRRLAFLEDDGPAPHDCEPGPAGGGVDALELFFRKDARKDATGSEMSGGNGGVIRDVAAQLEAARDLLRMIAMDTGIERKVWRAAEDKVEPLVGSKTSGAEIALADLVSWLETVISR